MAKQKRRKFEIVFNKRRKLWEGREQGHVLDEEFVYTKKSDAVSKFSKHVQAQTPSQLFVKGKDGRIQDERTYGDDPRRTKG